MVELMLSMSDYQPWLKSMLALADERQKDGRRQKAWFKVREAQGACVMLLGIRM